MTGGLAQAVESLLCKCKALSSSHIPPKKKKKVSILPKLSYTFSVLPIKVFFFSENGQADPNLYRIPSNYILKIKSRTSWAPVLTPVILVTQVAESRRIVVQVQLGQIVHDTLSQKYPSQKP
jgi:hypothetical protein